MNFSTGTTLVKRLIGNKRLSDRVVLNSVGRAYCT